MRPLLVPFLLLINVHYSLTEQGLSTAEHVQSLSINQSEAILPLKLDRNLSFLPFLMLFIQLKLCFRAIQSSTRIWNTRINFLARPARFVVRYTYVYGKYWYFLHLFLNVLLKLLLLFNNHIDLIYLHHIRVNIASNYVDLLI